MWNECNIIPIYRWNNWGWKQNKLLAATFLSLTRTQFCIKEWASSLESRLSPSKFHLDHLWPTGLLKESDLQFANLQTENKWSKNWVAFSLSPAILHSVQSPINSFDVSDVRKNCLLLSTCTIQRKKEDFVFFITQKFLASSLIFVTVLNRHWII